MKILLSATLALLLLGCSSEENSSSKQEVTQSVQKVAQVEKTVKQEIKKTVSKEPIKEVPVKVVEKETPKEVVQKNDGAKLFTKCVSCHGQNAEKKALNKSKIIRAWSVEQTVAAINGYKDGTYGGSMKGVMKPQVANLTKAEVQAVAEYISKL